MREFFCRLLLVTATFLLLDLAVFPLVGEALYVNRLASSSQPERLIMPVHAVKPSTIRDTWHASRDNGRRRHEGIDIFAARGTPVLSATEGIVSRIDVGGLGGKVVWILGPAKQVHYYAHLDAYADIRPGQRVRAGTILGYVGNTGNARTTPPHLHYGIYGATGPVNPYPMLKYGSKGRSQAKHKTKA